MDGWPRGGFLVAAFFSHWDKRRRMWGKDTVRCGSPTPMERGDYETAVPAKWRRGHCPAPSLPIPCTDHGPLKCTSTDIQRHRVSSPTHAPGRHWVTGSSAGIFLRTDSGWRILGDVDAPLACWDKIDENVLALRLSVSLSHFTTQLHVLLIVKKYRNTREGLPL